MWGTKEQTEQWIVNEVAALLHMPPGTLSVRAHRVGVHVGHFIDVRVKVRDRRRMQTLTVDDVSRVFESFAPLEALSHKLPSLPPHPIAVQREVGTPRPASHNLCHGGMQVAVGNLKLNDGVWDILFSVVVNNMVRRRRRAELSSHAVTSEQNHNRTTRASTRTHTHPLARTRSPCSNTVPTCHRMMTARPPAMAAQVRGAYGAALLMAEYYDHLTTDAAALVAARQAMAATSPRVGAGNPPLRPPLFSLSNGSSTDSAAAAAAAAAAEQSPWEASEDEAAAAEAAADLEAPTPLSHNLTSAAAIAEAAEHFRRDPGAAHGAIAREELHWYHAGRNAWLTWCPSTEESRMAGGATAAATAAADVTADGAQGAWRGWDAATGEASELAGAWTPWHVAFDDSKAPYFDWFRGGVTSAAFNMCDRHVLAGHGRETAFIHASHAAFAAHVARPGSLRAACRLLTRRGLLYSAVVAARVLKAGCGVGVGDRIVLLMPHGLEQAVWMQARDRAHTAHIHTTPHHTTVSNHCPRPTCRSHRATRRLRRGSAPCTSRCPTRSPSRPWPTACTTASHRSSSPPPTSHLAARTTVAAPPPSRRSCRCACTITTAALACSCLPNTRRHTL